MDLRQNLVSACSPSLSSTNWIPPFLYRCLILEFYVAFGFFTFTELILRFYAVSYLKPPWVIFNVKGIFVRFGLMTRVKLYYYATRLKGFLGQSSQLIRGSSNSSKEHSFLTITFSWRRRYGILFTFKLALFINSIRISNSIDLCIPSQHPMRSVVRAILWLNLVASGSFVQTPHTSY